MPAVVTCRQEMLTYKAIFGVIIYCQHSGNQMIVEFNTRLQEVSHICGCIYTIKTKGNYSLQVNRKLVVVDMYSQLRCSKSI